MPYRDPTEAELKDPLWNEIWQAIKSWDINVPEEYGGYTGATGNHVCVVYDILRAALAESQQPAAAARLDEADWWQANRFGTNTICHFCCGCEATLCLHQRKKCRNCERLAELRALAAQPTPGPKEQRND
jgi:hypothetical protein